MKREFSGQFFEKSQKSNFMKIHLVGAELFHVDRQEANINFSQFCECA